jgi:SAM-dependent methyltransferase
MSLRVWDERVVPRLTDLSLRGDDVSELRQVACAGLTGRVLEIGFGSGLNIRWYPPEVTSVTAIEPSDLGWQLSERRRARSQVPIERAGLDGQRLDLPDDSHDSGLITFSLCFFPILLTTIRGLNETEPELLDLVRALKGSRWQLFRYIQLPGSLPYVFSGMKVATILAVAGAVVGEFIASERGLGYLMIQVQASLDTPAVFMAVLLITGLGVLLYLLVLLLERLFITQDARIQ